MFKKNSASCKSISALIIISILLLFTACQDNPYNSQESISTIDTTVLVNTDSVEMIYDTYDNVILTEMNSLKISDRIQLPEFLSLPNSGSKIYNLTLAQCTDGIKFFDMQADSLLGRKIDQSQLKLLEGVLKGVFYENKNIPEYLSMSDVGFTYFYNFPIVYGAPRRTIFHINRNSILPSEVINLNGTDYAVSDAVKLSEEFLSEKWKKVNPDFDYKVNKIYESFNPETEENFISLEIGHYFEGVPFFDGELQRWDDTRFKPKNLRLLMFMHTPNEITGFDNISGILNIIEKKPVTENILTLQSAIDIVDKTYSINYSLNFSDIDIMYYVTYDSDIYNSGTPEEPKFADLQEGQIFTAKAYWAFTMDIPDSELKNDDGLITNFNVRKMIFVDILTGEIIDFMNPTYYGF